MEVIKQLLSNEYFVGVAMAVIIFGITQGLKQLIKLGTKKITNERARRIVNATILLIPFALGLLGEFLYGYFYLHTAFTGVAGLGYGTGAVSMYAAIERFFKVKIDNPYTDTEEGKAVQELVEKVQDDGKVDEKDISAVDEFWKTVNKGKTKSKK